MRRSLRLFATTLIAAGSLFVTASPGLATPVCTDGHGGGPPLAACGGRVFPESHATADYVQYLPTPGTGFQEFKHGIEALEKMYPRWVSVFTLRELYGDDAVSAGPDQQISYWETDSGDGWDIYVIKLTDHDVADEGKKTLLFSLSVHGDEKGGLEGGLRAVEDLAMAAEHGGTISDGVEGYESTTGVEPKIHDHEVSSVLEQEAVYFVAFNIDGWVTGETNNTLTGQSGSGLASRAPLYSRGNSRGTDLNRQMPTVGRINSSRNPLEESEMLYGHRFMHEVAEKGGGLMAYGADVHGESQSRAWADIMYPAGQFDSVKHRQLMAIAERTKSVMDDTLFLGLVDLVEENTGGDAGEGIEDFGAPSNTVPTKPARWGTVWDTLGYTDTGFIGDYMAAELGVTGMDYEIALNHSDVRAFGRPWSVVLQENYINATRAIVKTAMAYALYQDLEFASFTVDTGGGKVGYLFNPDVVTDSDEDGPGRLPGIDANGTGANGEPVEQVPYSATPMRFFEDTSDFVPGGLTPVYPADIPNGALEGVDSLVIADVPTPEDADGRAYDDAAYVQALRDWVEAGGNLVLTDRALHLLGDLGVVAPTAIRDINVYQPYADFTDFSHPLLAGLRPNARQLAEFTLIGFGIGNSASPMTIVTTSAWQGAGGTVVGTTAGDTQTSVGELGLGEGRIRILGGGLRTPTESQDHRYGLKDYALTYTGLYILENAMKHDAPGLGTDASSGSLPAAGAAPLIGLLPVLGAVGLRRRRTAAA